MFSNCPSNIVATADRGATSTLVTWSRPTATDNSGIIPNITHYGKQPGDLFPAGEHNIRYWASDKSGNVGECKFKVFVLGNLWVLSIRTKKTWLECRFFFLSVKVYNALKKRPKRFIIMVRKYQLPVIQFAIRKRVLKVDLKWLLWQPATPF